METCPICYDELLTDVVELECNHKFHKKCFENYILYYLTDIGYKKNDKDLLINFFLNKPLNIQHTNRINVLYNKKCPYCRSDIDLYNFRDTNIDISLYSKSIDELLCILKYEDDVDPVYYNSLILKIVDENVYIPIDIVYLIISQTNIELQFSVLLKLFDKINKDELKSEKFIELIILLLYSSDIKNVSSNILIDIIKIYFQLDLFVDDEFHLLFYLVEKGILYSRYNSMYKLIVLVDKIIDILLNEKIVQNKMHVYNILLSDVFIFRLFYHSCLENYDYYLLEQFISNELIESKYFSELELIYLPEKYIKEIEFQDLIAKKLKEPEVVLDSQNRYSALYIEKLKLKDKNRYMNIIYLCLVNIINDKAKIFKFLLSIIPIEELKKYNRLHIDLCDIIQVCQHRQCLNYYYALYKFIQKLNLNRNVEGKFITRFLQCYFKRIQFNITCDFVYSFVNKYGVKSLNLHNLYSLGDNVLSDLILYLLHQFVNRKKVITDYIKFLVGTNDEFICYILKSFPNITYLLYKNYNFKFLIDKKIQYENINTTPMHIMFYYSKKKEMYLELIESSSEFKTLLSDQLEYIDDFGRNIFETLIVKKIDNKYIFVKRFILAFINELDLNAVGIYSTNISDLMDFAKL